AAEHAIFVDHAQIGEAHVHGIVVAAKAEAVPRIEPTEVGVPALARPPNGHHLLPPFLLSLTPPSELRREPLRSRCRFRSCRRRARRRSRAPRSSAGRSPCG